MLARELLYNLVSNIHTINEEVLRYNRKIYALIHQMKDTQKLMMIPSVGEHNVTAIVATVSDGKQFQTSRQFTAWIGLVPRQYTTGCQIQLGRKNKRGDKHICTSLIHDAHAIIARCNDKTDRNRLWLQLLVKHRLRGTNASACTYRMSLNSVSKTAGADQNIRLTYDSHFNIVASRLARPVGSQTKRNVA